MEPIWHDGKAHDKYQRVNPHYVYEATHFTVQGPLLLTWFNFNANMDK